jgi:hypothetical protein
MELAMLTIKNKIEDNYFLPNDSKEAKTRLLEFMALPEETYISCYGFTLQEAYDAILELDAKGVKQSVLLDYSQGNGPSAKSKIKNLILNCKNAKIILTAAGPKSNRPTSAFFHIKGMVKIPSDKRKSPLCMDGSTNITVSGFSQTNTMRFFSNKAYADKFVEQHLEVRDWAIKTLPHYQPTILADSCDAVDYFFDNLSFEDSDLLI